VSANNKALLDGVIRRSLAELDKAVVPRAAPEPEKPEPKRNGQQKQGRAGLDADEWRVFEHIVRFFDDIRRERLQALRIDENEDWRAMDELKRKGLVKEAGRVGRHVIPFPTEKGWALAEKNGLERPKFQSGPLHEALRRRLMRGLKSAVEGIDFRTNGVTKGVRQDLLALLPGGAVVALQVTVTNKPDYETERLVELARDESTDRVVLVAANKAKASAVRKELRKLEKKEKSASWPREKVGVFDAGSVLDTDFDWRELVGLQSEGGKEQVS